MFYKDQVDRVSQFVKRHPSHRFVEVFIYSREAEEVMKQAFGIHRDRWGHSNRGFHDKLKQ